MPEAPQTDPVKHPPIATSSKRSLLAPGPVMGQVIEEAEEEGEEYDDDEAAHDREQQQESSSSPVDVHMSEPGLEDATNSPRDGGRDGASRLFTTSLSIPAFAGRKLRIPVRVGVLMQKISLILPVRIHRMHAFDLHVLARSKHPGRKCCRPS